MILSEYKWHHTGWLSDLSRHMVVFNILLPLLFDVIVRAFQLNLNRLQLCFKCAVGCNEIINSFKHRFKRR